MKQETPDERKIRTLKECLRISEDNYKKMVRYHKKIEAHFDKIIQHILEENAHLTARVEDLEKKQ